MQNYKNEFLWNNQFGDAGFEYGLAHTDYTIYAPDGKVFKKVQNAQNPNDPQPAIVSLPPGRYQVEAVAQDYGTVEIPVVIEPGKLTVVNLQRTPNPVVESVNRNDAVLLGGDRIVGWRSAVATNP
jgi:hypothetical protein